MMAKINRNTLKKAVTIEFADNTSKESLIRNAEDIAKKTGMIVGYVFEESEDSIIKYSKAMIDKAIKKSIERYSFNKAYFWDHLKEEA